ncbi:MAG: sodium:proton antiporter, partial [Alistipes sp.]|nr:sodium:proton antiporter [Alistipes sp.]
MITTLIIVFCAGYLLIALEHKIGINKSAVALLMCGALWAIFGLAGHDPQTGTQLSGQLSSTCEILVYLIGAMTIVDLIDTHGG